MQSIASQLAARTDADLGLAVLFKLLYMISHPSHEY